MSLPFTPENVAAQKAQFEKAGQGHVYTFWDSLSDPEQKKFFQQLQQIDPERVNKLRELALNPPKEPEQTVVEPLPSSATASILDSKPEDIQRWYNLGLELISKGEVAVILLAGGQGTRLGSAAPKGCYDIGLPSHKSLFQLQAERILKVQKLAQETHKTSTVPTIPWYVMTSGPTRKPTEKYFRGEDLEELDESGNSHRKKYEPFFGVQQENIEIFEQGVLPCLTFDGKFMLAGKGEVQTAPDGNGGLYKALQDADILGKMAKKGVKHVYAYCVDNCLSKVADPVFIGFAAEQKVKIATKVVRKTEAGESVGLIMSKNGRPDVVEYSEIDQATAEAKDPQQPDLLKFRAANIVNHYYSLDYLTSMGDAVNQLPPHVAKKKIKFLDIEKGEKVDPKEPNGIKLEQFVFDNFKWLELNEFACFEVDRKEEFSPLKNADGPKAKDCPATSRHDILAQGRRWVEAAGAKVGNNDKDGGLEVSPLRSYAGEGLEEYKGQTITSDRI
ncbi:nucleotide-diphospho-sugar transferase [Xylariomycetidae sp. FL2044]|nr:nucleotide-diphospho-sugar transferase [Xylariomycetidae sp. FL2044]